MLKKAKRYFSQEERISKAIFSIVIIAVFVSILNPLADIRFLLQTGKLVLAVGFGYGQTQNQNDDSVPGTTGIRVNVTTIGGNATFGFNLKGTPNLTVGPSSATFDISTVSNQGSNTQSSLNSGTYTLKQTLPGGWTETKNTCGYGIDVTGGRIIDCYVENILAEILPTPPTPPDQPIIVIKLPNTGTHENH